MSRLARLSGLVGIALAASTLTTATSVANASTGNSGGERGGGVFAETDAVSGNQVVAYARSASGKLSLTGIYDTLGRGGVLGDSVVDHTASQGAVAYDPTQRLLYAVNAGSNTITVFAVHDDNRLTRLQVIGSGGDFPVSIAVHGHLVYVLNARDGGSIQGYLSVGGRLVAIPSWHRQLGLDAAATPEFTSTPGQVAFSPDGLHLLVTTKANTNAVDVFRIGPLDDLSRLPVVTSLPGTVPFSLTFDRSGNVALAEAGPSAVATFRLNADGSLAPLTVADTGQAATCWIVRSGNTVYTGNAGSSTVSAYRIAPNGSLAALGNSAAPSGTVDLGTSPDGAYLYVRGGADGTIGEFRLNPDGSLTNIGVVTVPNAVGGEGIATS